MKKLLLLLCLLASPAFGQSTVPPRGPSGDLGVYVSASSGNVAAAIASATLAADATRQNFLCGFSITAGGATAGAVVNFTITGMIGGTMTYAFAAPTGAAVGATPLVVTFPVCIPATGDNVAIVASLPSLGAGNTNASVNIWGFKL